MAGDLIRRAVYSFAYSRLRRLFLATWRLDDGFKSISCQKSAGLLGVATYSIWSNIERTEESEEAVETSRSKQRL